MAARKAKRTAHGAAVETSAHVWEFSTSRFRWTYHARKTLGDNLAYQTPSGGWKYVAYCRTLEEAHRVANGFTLGHKAGFDEAAPKVTAKRPDYSVALDAVAREVVKQATQDLGHEPEHTQPDDCEAVQEAADEVHRELAKRVKELLAWLGE